MITTVLFDLDETLLDRSATLLRFIHAQFQKHQLHHYEISLERWTSRFVELDKRGYEERDVIYDKLIQEFGLHSFTSQALVDDFMDNIHQFCIPMDGMFETLEYLHDTGIKVGIITNGGDAVQKRKIEEMGIRRFASLLLTSGGEQIEKPDAEIFRRGMKQLGVTAAECLFVGDHPINDVHGAKAVGMRTAWISRGFPWTLEDIQPDFSIDCLKEIIEIIEQNRIPA